LVVGSDREVLDGPDYENELADEAECGGDLRITGFHRRHRRRIVLTVSWTAPVGDVPNGIPLSFAADGPSSGGFFMSAGFHDLRRRSPLGAKSIGDASRERPLLL
jgi:hypothetical protein